MPDVNDTAPDFTLLDTGRQSHSLSDYRGKKVVLAFYPGAFTGVCTVEMCAWQDSIGQLNDANAVVLGISVDSPFANGAFAKANAVTFALLSDWSREVTDAWGMAFENFAGIEGYTASNRAVFIINEEGQITYKWVAPSLGTEPDYAAVIAALA